MYADYEIREVPIGYGPARRKVEEFLGKRTLRLDKVDYYEAIYPCGGDEMLAVGGLLGDAIRCIAVKEGMEDEHLANRLVSHLMVIVQRRGYPTVKVFTKPSNKAVFESLAFETLAETDSVVFMENGQMPGLSAEPGAAGTPRQVGRDRDELQPLHPRPSLPHRGGFQASGQPIRYSPQGE